LSSSVPKRQKTHLAVFEVVKQDVETLALDAILLHHDARTSDNFTWVALPINLAQPGPSTKDLSISDLDQVNFVLGTESLDELDVLCLSAGLHEDAQMGMALVQSFGALTETTSETIVDQSIFQYLL
jgi:hypothetical protein